jgi:Glycosyl transferase family 2
VNDLKIAIVVMAYNPYQFFSEFIIHNKNLVDHVYVIDHRSGKKLSSLDIQGVTFIESNQVAQFQSEVTNALIRDFKLHNKYDWIFVLDIDEFLPFNCKSDLYQFLHKFKNDKVLAFNWRNGVGVYPTVDAKIQPEDSLIDVSPLLISDHTNPNIKVAVNCTQLNYPFYFRTGAHEVIQPREILSKFSNKNEYKSIKPAKQHHFLYHIVSYDRESFYKKIQNYVNQMEMRKHVKGQGGWMVSEYLTDFDDSTWLDIIQNFRVSNKALIMNNVSESIFSRIDLFGHLSLKVQSLDQKLLLNSNEAEQRYIRNKSLDTDLTKNLQSFIVKTEEYSHKIEII